MVSTLRLLEGSPLGLWRGLRHHATPGGPLACARGGYALLLGTPQDSGRREDMPLDMLNPGAVRIQPPQGNLTVSAVA